MRIRGAKQFFQYWGDALSLGFDGLRERKGACNPERGITTYNNCLASFLTDYVFRATPRHIRMLSEAEGDGFLRTLRISFEGALKRIAGKKDSVLRVSFSSKHKSEVPMDLGSFFPSELRAPLQKNRKNM